MCLIFHTSFIYLFGITVLSHYVKLYRFSSATQMGLKHIYLLNLARKVPIAIQDLFFEGVLVLVSN